MPKDIVVKNGIKTAIGVIVGCAIVNPLLGLTDMKTGFLTGIIAAIISCGIYIFSHTRRIANSDVAHKHH